MTRRRFVISMLAVVVVVGILRTIVLRDAWASDPLMGNPVSDAQVYWEWAGRIADGQLVGDTPFLSAPLYPYMLGVIRASGGGMPAVFAVQVVLHLLTIVLVGWGAARRFDRCVGLLAAVLFALLTDPAFYTGRLLNCSLQLFLVAALWVRWTALDGRPSYRGWLECGLLLGLNCLANPPMLLGVPLFAAWIWFRSRRGGRRLWGPIAGVAGAVAAIAPATIHNYLACGEFIPIAAQGGLTFYHGNNPGSWGTYAMAEGVSRSRAMQNLDAMRRARDEGGASGWRDADRFYYRKGFSFWAEHPGRSISLTFVKAYWFLTGRHFGDIYLPTMEFRAGVYRGLVVSPLSLAWLMPVALAAWIGMLRRPIRFGPELVLFGVPMLVVWLFWYSPRYRLPVSPVAVVLAASMMVGAARAGTRSRRGIATLGLLGVGLVLGGVNEVTGFDAPGPYRAQFARQLGLAFVREGRVDDAIARFRESVAVDPKMAAGHASLSDALRRAGQFDEALNEAERAVQLGPNEAEYVNNLGLVLVDLGRTAEAQDAFGRAVELNPDRVDCRNNLANVLSSLGNDEEAIEQYRAAIELAPRSAAAHFNLAMLLRRMGRSEAAVEHFERVMSIDPTMTRAAVRAGETYLELGDEVRGLGWLRQAYSRGPDVAEAANALAWALVVRGRDAGTALSAAQRAAALTEERDASVLDTLACALAANGRFDEAVVTGRKAQGMAERSGLEALADEIRGHVGLFEKGVTLHDGGR